MQWAISNIWPLMQIISVVVGNRVRLCTSVQVQVCFCYYDGGDVVASHHVINTNKNLNYNIHESCPSGGRYLSVPELKVGQRSVRGARLAVHIVPPWSHGDLCFSFSHWLTGHHVGVLQLFVRKTGRDQRYQSQSQRTVNNV